MVEKTAIKEILGEKVGVLPADLIEVELKRDDDSKGITLKIKSAIIESWIKGISAGTKISAAVGWVDHSYHNITSAPTTSKLKSFMNVGSDYYSNGPNLALLTAEGLSEGITYRFTGGNYSYETLRKFLEELRDNSILIYKEHIKTFDCSMRVIMEESV